MLVVSAVWAKEVQDFVLDCTLELSVDTWSEGVRSGAESIPIHLGKEKHQQFLFR
jgi:hypothetical protein